MKSIKMKITKGALRINRGYIWKKGKDITLLLVDMHSKRGDIIAYGEENNAPELIIGANKDSLYLNNKLSHNSLTNIIFPELKGWTIIMANISKYSIYVCLIK